jgi:hypothetical protein
VLFFYIKEARLSRMKKNETNEGKDICVNMVDVGVTSVPYTVKVNDVFEIQTKEPATLASWCSAPPPSNNEKKSRSVCVDRRQAKVRSKEQQSGGVTSNDMIHVVMIRSTTSLSFVPFTLFLVHSQRQQQKDFLEKKVFFVVPDRQL